MEGIEVVCINDEYKPETIPLSKWVKKGRTYHIVKIMKLKMQGGIAGVKLAELNIDEYFPYQYFALSRFDFPIVKLAEAIASKEMVEEV